MTAANEPLMGCSQTKTSSIGMNMESDDEQLVRQVSMRPLLVAAVAFTSFIGALLGYDIGVISGAILGMQDELELSDHQSEIIVGALNVVAAFGGLASGPLADRLGRKGTIASASLLFIFGTGIMCFASSFTGLLLGRVIMGAGIGAGFVIGPLYAAELSPAEFRGRLASLFEVAIGVGILLGYLGAWLCHGLGWRAMVGLGAVPPFVILVCLLCLPESPRYLLAAGQEEKARAVLMRVMDAEAVPQCMQEMQTALQRLQEQEGEEALRLLCCPTRAVAMMMLVGFGVCLAQQANGSEAVVYYIPHILKHAGVEGREQQLRLTMLIGACRTVFIAVGTLLVDHWGRRPLLLTSTGGATVALLWLAVSLGTGWPLWCVMGALCLFMISYAVGLGPVNMVILSEIFPYKLRATAMSMAVFMNRIVSGTVASTFLSLTQWLGASGAFLMFAFISLASTVFVFTTVPETRGRSLEQMEAFFEDMVQHGATEHRRLEEPLQQ